VNFTFLAFQTLSTLFHVRQHSLIGDIISTVYSNLVGTAVIHDLNSVFLRNKTYLKFDIMYQVAQKTLETTIEATSGGT
jgi:hypothetical protein